MVSVFDANGNVLYQIGLPIRQTFDDNSTTHEIAEATEHGEGQSLRTSIVNPSQMFFYAARKSNDGRIFVHTAMPFSASITDALKTESYMWYISITLAVTVTIIAYFSTRYIGKNIRLLRDFANRAANSRTIDVDMKFPHDELGDISRQIVRIYRDKDKAMTRSEHEHQVALRATEEKARIKRQLTNNINHELKTPVGVIKGYLDTIASTPDLPDELRRSFLEKARQNVERLCSLLNDVSTITRLDESRNKIPTTEIDYHDLVYDVSNDLDASHINGDLSFNFDIPFDCKVKGNYALLSGMLFNLIRNAATYSHGTEINLRLTNESHAFYTFSFSDDGIGVSPEHLPHLFERFYRVDSGRMRKSAQSGGTGLGLPIVKNTVLTFGGSITVRNAPNRGLE
ncbi:MAG: HAMP domain-containing histidine kinase, partial [Muribaculaceae bacterium]|nr:HAMP domain-containing histidine kinase [Muribaculaceae bacterium]